VRALVTGGAGFIGSNLVDALLARGEEVLALDDLSTGRRENLGAAVDGGGGELVVGDVRDPRLLEREFERFRPDAVFHLAAQVDVRKSIADPAHDAEVNVIGTIRLLEACRAAGTGRLVFASTGGAIYGEGEGRELPLAETAECLPDAHYGQSKHAAEGYCGVYSRLHGLSTVAVRLGNVYGPRQDPLGEAGVVAIFCNRLLGGERPTVFGDGRQTRDYVYVGDVVEAMLAAAGSDAGGVYNVGTGVETSVLDLVEGLARVSGSGAFDPEPAPPRPGEVQRIAIDPARAERELGWRARVELMDEGLERTLAWAREAAAA
jgi:UDP-glucose 4-epimerase